MESDLEVTMIASTRGDETMMKTSRQWIRLGWRHAKAGREPQYPQQPEYMSAYNAMVDQMTQSKDYHADEYHSYYFGD